MMTRYVWRNDGFVDRATGEPLQAPDRIGSPMVVRDIHYRSPISGQEITSRSARREEMKRHNVREVDPSEFTPRYAKRRNAEANRRDVEKIHTAPPPADDGTYQRLSMADLPVRIRKTVSA